MLDFFAIFGNDKRFSECKAVLAKQAAGICKMSLEKFQEKLKEYQII